MTANNQPFEPPKSPFRDSYTNLVLAVWQNPDLENQIAANPASIAEYGFKVVPRSIRFEPPGETLTAEEYEVYQAEFTADEEVTLHIPQKPTIQPEGVVAQQVGGTVITCCCTPCCSCGGGRPGGRPPQDPS